MRLPRTFPSPIIAPVLIILSATFVALPAFNLVDPAKISGPTGSVITRSATVEAAVSAAAGDAPATTGRSPSPMLGTAGLQVSKIVFAPNDFACASAPNTKGVRPLAVSP